MTHAGVIQQPWKSCVEVCTYLLSFVLWISNDWALYFCTNLPSPAAWNPPASILGLNVKTILLTYKQDDSISDQPQFFLLYAVLWLHCHPSLMLQRKEKEDVVREGRRDPRSKYTDTVIWPMSSIRIKIWNLDSTPNDLAFPYIRRHDHITFLLPRLKIISHKLIHVCMCFVFTH